MKALIGLFGAVALAIFGAIVGAMFTTPYASLRENGASYLPALASGLHALWSSVLHIVISPWVLVPVGAALLVLATAKVTLRVSKPKKLDKLVELGVRMETYIQMGHHDQKFRRFSSHYNDTMRVCREYEAFMVSVEQSGLPIPHPQSDYAEEWIDIACDYFTAVAPFLRNDQFSHAVSYARTFADRYPLRR